MNNLSNANSHNVCVVTLTYGERAFLSIEVLQAVIELGVQKIIVVDNGSKKSNYNKIESFVSKYEKIITLIRLNNNIGSAGGFKIGLRKALHSDCRFVWLLDDDNKPDKNSLNELIKAQKKYPNGVCASIRTDRKNYIDYVQGKSSEYCFGYKSSFIGFSYRNLIHKIFNPFKKNKEELGEYFVRKVPFVPYGGLFLKSSILKKIGFPNEDFFLYGDDIEYTYRITKMNIPIYLIPTSMINDIDKSWFLKKQDSYFISRYIKTKLSRDLRIRLYYSTRNRVYFEYHKRKNNKVIYWTNMFIYLSILMVIASSGTLLKFSKSPMESYYIIIKSVIDGMKMKLGKNYL